MAAPSANHLLSAISLLWAVGLLCIPAAHAAVPAFWTTCTLLVVNTIASLMLLTATRRIPVLLNAVQLGLFGLLASQLAATYGASHYQYERPPRWYDWVEFLLAHVLRATDLLDAIDEFGIPIQSISHASRPAGAILVWMHVSVDVFLFGLLVRWFQGFRARSRSTVLQQQRRVFAFFLLSLLCLFLCLILAAVEGWSSADRFRWPLDNLLRLIDFGDSMQIFGWRLHDVEPTDFNRGLAVFFRFTAGVWMGAIVVYVRLALMRGWGYSSEQLVELLQDGDAFVRRSAATSLGPCRRDAAQVVPALVGGLEDFDREVRRCAVHSLGTIGPAARPAVPMILDELVRTSSTPFHLDAVRALGRIGPRDRDLADTVYCLELLQACYADETETRRAIDEILPLLGGPRWCPRDPDGRTPPTEGTRGPTILQRVEQPTPGPKGPG
jgi:hypothetical protein